jgi:hypothetical protein
MIPITPSGVFSDRTRGTSKQIRPSHCSMLAYSGLSQKLALGLYEATDFLITH